MPQYDEELITAVEAVPIPICSVDCT